MKITELRPMMWTEDIPGTIDFYTKTLDFTCIEYNDDWGWASLSIGNVGVMLARPNEHAPYEKIGFTGSFYFNTDDVDALWKQLKDKHASATASKTSNMGCVNLRSTTTMVICCNSGRRSASRTGRGA